MIRSTILLASLLLLAGPGMAGTAPPREIVRASLLAERTAAVPGTTFQVALRMRIAPGWHVYWRNPGDSGLPPEMAWRLPDGFSAGAFSWPVPERIPAGGMMNYGYAGEATLIADMKAPSGPASGAATLAGHLTYLACQEICVPGETDVSLELPISGSASPDPANEEAFAAARRALPIAPPSPVRLTAAAGALSLRLDRPGLSGEGAAFFPYSDTAIENAADQAVAIDPAGLTLTLVPADPKAPPSALPGVLVVRTPEGEVGYLVGADPAAGPSVARRAPTQPREADPTLAAAIGLAFLGGLLLNLMPCVFPVLSIKLLGLIRQAGESRARVRLHGLAYAAGVLSAFLALGGTLAGLRAAGAGVGWGFQLQSPGVVAALAGLTLAMGLGLSGVFEIGARIAGLGDGLTRRPGYQGSAFAGALATVVATPCTAPFMGTAVGFAATQPAPAALAVFASLGAGLAFPFLLLTAFPSAVRLLPRPGRWMGTLKHALALPLYATAAWLLWVLSRQVGPAAFAAIGGGLLLAANLAALRAGTARSARASGAVASAGLIAALLLQPPAASADAAEGIEPYARARLEAIRSQGRPVFVDLTAAWCITCQINERGALAGKEVRDAFRSRDVAYLRGDWTNRDPEITALLADRGRDGVPLYLLYPPAGEPETLPQILTRSAVLEALAALGPPGAR